MRTVEIAITPGSAYFQRGVVRVCSIRSVDGAAISTVAAVPVQAQHGGVVGQDAACHVEGVVGEGTHRLAGVKHPSVCDRLGEVETGRVALEHAVGHQDQPVAGSQHEVGRAVRRVGEQPEREVHGQLDGGDVGTAGQVRRDVPGVHQLHRAGAQVEAADQTCHEVLEPADGRMLD